MVQRKDLNHERLPDRLQSLHVAQSEYCVNTSNDAISHRTLTHREDSLSRKHGHNDVLKPSTRISALAHHQSVAPPERGICHPCGRCDRRLCRDAASEIGNVIRKARPLEGPGSQFFASQANPLSPVGHQLRTSAGMLVKVNSAGWMQLQRLHNANQRHSTLNHAARVVLSLQRR